MARPKYRPNVAQALARAEQAQPQPMKHSDDLIEGIVSHWTITPTDAAWILGTSVRTLGTLKLPHIRLGQVVRYDLKGIKEYIQRYNRGDLLNEEKQRTDVYAVV